MTEQIPVIYILSNGRSGTTLLDLLLGSAPGAWTLGEAQLLPWELRDNRRPCGCGKDFDECPFWRRVLDDIDFEGSQYPVDYFRESHGAGKVLRWNLLLDLISGQASGRSAEAVEEYSRLNHEYFGSVWETAEERGHGPIHWLVDASMDPYRLLWLKAGGDFDLRVIHLTKSPPSFVYSMVKKDLPGASRKTARMAGRWLIENALMLRLSTEAFPAENVQHLRYEDLAGNPKTVRDGLSDWLCIEFPKWIGKSFRSSVNHAVAGNKMRWEDTKIRLDQRWKQKLPSLHRELIWAVSSPLAEWFGYSRKATESAAI